MLEKQEYVLPKLRESEQRYNHQRECTISTHMYEVLLMHQINEFLPIPYYEKLNDGHCRIK